MEGKVPIILDCYADWCGPCKKLTPVLEKVTNEYEGKFKLVKLNIDTLPELTKALNVKSVPTCFLIYKGNVMDQMLGFDTTKLEALIETALLVDKAANDETVITKVID
jgi:thioredoxin